MWGTTPSNTVWRLSIILSDKYLSHSTLSLHYSLITQGSSVLSIMQGGIRVLASWPSRAALACYSCKGMGATYVRC